MPLGLYYLTVTVDVLLHCYETAGCETTHEYLTSTGLRWHRGRSLLFEICQAKGHGTCKCDRIQQIQSRLGVKDVIPPRVLAPMGAAIFGRPRHSRSVSSFRERFRFFGSKKRTDSLSEGPDKSEELDDSQAHCEAEVSSLHGNPVSPTPSDATSAKIQENNKPENVLNGRLRRFNPSSPVNPERPNLGVNLSLSPKDSVHEDKVLLTASTCASSADNSRPAKPSEPRMIPSSSRPRITSC